MQDDRECDHPFSQVSAPQAPQLATSSSTFEPAVARGKPEPPKNWLDDIWAKSVNALSAVGVFLAKVGVFLFVFSPIWITVVAVVLWLRVRASRAA